MAGHIILFEHANFHGAHKHVFDEERNLNADDDDFFNDRVSSFVVIEGTWKLYLNSEFQVPFDREFPPSRYPSV